MDIHTGFLISPRIVAESCVDLPLPLSSTAVRRANEPLRRRRRALFVCMGLNMLILMLSFWLIGPFWA